MNFSDVKHIAWKTIAEALGIDNVEDSQLIFQAKTYTVATVPSASDYPRGIIYVSDETGGATIAFSDGTSWRRVQDRAVIS